MHVNRLTLTRDGYYGSGYNKADPSKPFRAIIEVEGSHGKVELNLSPELSQRMVALVADEVAAAGRATADALVANCLNALPAPKVAA